MRRNRHGIALVMALSLMLVLMTVVGLLSMVAVSDMRQSRSSVQQMQARAIAEAGEVYARYAAASAAQPAIRTALRDLMDVNAAPATQWVISKDKWPKAQTKMQEILNESYGELAASELSDLGFANITYDLRNFRGGTQSSTAQAYFVDYTVVATGTASGAVRRVEDKGVFEIQIGKPPLSQYLFLVDDASGEIGFFPTGSRFNGPVHANKNWGFRGEPEFLDTITTAAAGAWFYCVGKAKEYIEGDARPPCTLPKFAKGFTRNVPEVDLPTSSLSQSRAALGLDPESSDEVGAVKLCNVLRVRSDCSSNSSVPNDIYVVNDGSSITGGIYVKGDLSQLLLDGSSRDGIQVYELKQGTSNVVRIEVNHNTGTTTVTRSVGMVEKVLTFSGTPNGPAPLGTGGPTGQIYVEGAITTLEGPGRVGNGDLGSDPPDHPVPDAVLPALALETELNITATNRIDLRSDLVYECDPTAMADSDYLSKRKRCDLSGAMLPTVLGVMSLTDNVEITTSTPDNLYLWGSYLAGTAGKGLSVENHSGRHAQGTLRLFGGLIQSADQLRGRVSGETHINGYLETFDYDLRFANGAVAPPNFPTVRTFDVHKIIPVKLAFREY